MRLGDYKFSLSTAAYQSLTRSTAYSWQSGKRFGKLPTQQFTGIDTDTINMQGIIYSHFAGGLSQIDAMREQAGRGEPLLLVDGHGFVKGKWCIKSIEQTDTVFLSDGTPRKIEFNLSLVRYGDENE
jgi:hypothetical protein